MKLVRVAAGVSREEAAAHTRNENIPLALAGWFSGSIMIWSSLFAVGNYLYGRTGYALGLTVVFLASCGILIRVVSRLWQRA